MIDADGGEGATPAPRRCFRSSARALVAVLGIAFAAAQFSELHFMLDNLSNFPVHFAAIFFACAIVLLIARDLRWAIVSATAVFVCLVPVVPWYFSAPQQTPNSGAISVKLLVSNVYLRNRQHARLVELIGVERPDVVGLVEVNSRWLRKLSPLHTDFSYRFEAPDEHYFGLALYSKFPLKDPRILRLEQFHTPSIAATLALPDGEVELILMHPLSPLNGISVKRRNAQLQALGRYIEASKRPVVLAGDLNVAMWNRNYRSVAAKAGLQNARAGIGVAPTWPAVPALGVPIDHIMATAPVKLRNFRVLPGIGSDHLPISADFLLAPPEPRHNKIAPQGH